MAPELAVFLSALTPVGELRLSIPLGLQAYHLPWPQVLLLSLVGNMVPVLILAPVLKKISKILEHLPFISSPFQWYLRLVTGGYRPLIQRYGPLALVLIVAVPLPGTGAWTGVLLSWALSLPWRRAIPAIGMGVVIAGALVTFLTLLGRTLWGA